MITVKRIWQRGTWRGEARGEGRGWQTIFRDEKAVIKPRGQGIDRREIQLQSHTYCTRKSSWTIPLILQRRQTIANDTRCEFAWYGYNCPVVVTYGNLVPVPDDLLQTGQTWRRDSIAGFSLPGILDFEQNSAKNEPRGDWISEARFVSRFFVKILFFLLQIFNEIQTLEL